MFSGYNEIKIEICKRLISENSSNTLKLGNTSLNYTWVKEEIKIKVRTYLELQRNKATAYQNCWHDTEGVIRGKFISTKHYKRLNC